MAEELVVKPRRVKESYGLEGRLKKPSVTLDQYDCENPTNADLRLVFSFNSASHDAATVRKSAQFSPNINPERAAAQSQAVPVGAESRNRCRRLFHETEPKSRAAPTSAITNVRASGRISNKWKMLHQDVP